MQQHIDGRLTEFEAPDICPICHVANRPAFLGVYRNDGNGALISVWDCANKQCNHLIFAIGIWNGLTYVHTGFLNGTPNIAEWPEPIKTLQSGTLDNEGKPITTKFIETYLQSVKAEYAGLNEIAGMGYRKAIEYLVKDWAIASHPDSKDEILNLWLGQVTSKFYKGDLKDLLERATWLGNDQSHYLQVFKEYDIDTLKDLINLIVSEFDRDFRKRHYIETIKKKNL